MSDVENLRRVMAAALLREARVEAGRGRRLRSGRWQDPGAPEPGEAPVVTGILWLGIALAGLGLVGLAALVV